MENIPNSFYKSFLRNYYLTTALYDFVFAYAVYNVLFSIRGLSVFQISLLLSFWAFIAVIFEIPTGALADYWSRKKMLELAPIIKSICFVIWFFASGNIYLFGLGFVFWALGSSFVSGTSEALLYDTLNYVKKTDDYEKILGKRKLYFYAALAVSIIAGGLIASYKIEYAIIFSVFPLLLSSFFAFRLKEFPKVESTGEVHYLEYIKIAAQEIKSNKILLYLFIYLFAMSIFGSLEEYNQLYFKIADLPLFAFGIAGFLYSLVNAVGAYFAHRMKKYTSVLFIFPIISGIMLVIVSKFASIPMIGLLLFSYLFSSTLEVIIESKIQRNIKSISRATVTSISNLLICIFGVFITFSFGIISRVWNFQTIYLGTAIFLFVFAICALIVKSLFYDRKGR